MLIRNWIRIDQWQYIPVIRINIGTYGGTSEATISPIDSDNDGLTDYLENTGCTDPFDADSDDDGISDCAEDANHSESDR